MKFLETNLLGAFVIEPEFIADERGSFGRTYCSNEFSERGLKSCFVQSSISYNKQCGTLRGMHFQKSPYAEAKLVRCTQGAIYDVIVDLRTDSKTFTRWVAVELTSKNRRALYVPEGFAHGFITLLDDTEVLYCMSEFFNAESAGGVRWDDALFGIQWPCEVRMISDRDRSYPDFLP